MHFLQRFHFVCFVCTSFASCTTYFGSWDQEYHESLGIQTYDTIIIGAGMAGISLGDTLIDEDVSNILIIEAQDYVGGRTKVVPFEGLSLNAGASWITQKVNSSRSGLSGNPMYVEAIDQGFNIFEFDWSSTTLSPFQSSLHGVDKNLTYPDYVASVCKILQPFCPFFHFPRRFSFPYLLFILLFFYFFIFLVFLLFALCKDIRLFCF